MMCQIIAEDAQWTDGLWGGQRKAGAMFYKLLYKLDASISVGYGWIQKN